MEAYSRKGLASRSSRHMPMMRLVVVGVLLLEGIIAALVGEYATTSNFYITTVATTDNLTVVGNNPDLNYPVYLGGERCTAAALLECRETDTSICCMELFDPNGSGPEESVTVLQIFAYACVIPFFLLVVRGILLGRVCTKLAEVKYKKGRLPGRPAKGPYPGPYYNPQNGHRHRRSWHKRVGFYSADTILGLLMSVANAYMWTEIVKVLVGRPRPNYQTLHVYSSLAASRKDFTADSILSFPSSHSSVAMSGLAYLAYVLWADIRALVEWRRQAHPRFTLGLALVMGAFMLLLPFSAVAVAITRVQDYWHRPDDVMAGLILGALSAHWAFRLFLRLPFQHEQALSELALGFLCFDALVGNLEVQCLFLHASITVLYPLRWLQ